MNLTQSILSSKPREESGSKTSRKYSFQYNLSLYLLLKKHEDTGDYVYLFDYHDDLMVLDSPDNPQNIDFYQIKSKDTGTWTINSLTDKKNGKSSIVGKMYLNKIMFPNHTRSLNFISNARFNFKLTDGKSNSQSKDEISAADVHKDELAKCEKAICKEHECEKCDDFKDIAGFHVTALSNKDSEAHCLGALSGLIHSLNSGHKVNPKLAYDQIIGEVRKKTNTTVGDRAITNIYELIELKGITKTKFLEFLEKAGLYRSVEDDWRSIENQLTSCAVGSIGLAKYRKAYRDVEMRLIGDVNKLPLQAIQAEIRKIIIEGSDSKAINDKSSLTDIVDYCMPKISTTSYDYDEYFVRSLIIRSIMHETN